MARSEKSRAIIIGGSMAGLMAARVLSDHFDEVVVLERDRLRDRPEARKGQPQARHLHGLLARGLDTFNDYFPGFTEDLKDRGALTLDMGEGMHWHAFDGYRIRHHSGLEGALMSRPLLEWTVRDRVKARDNVTFRDQTSVRGLLHDGDRQRVIGVSLEERGRGEEARDTSGDNNQLFADLVVDATGLGSRSEHWLEEMGFTPPQRTEVGVGIGYASRLYRRRPADLPDADLIMISPAPPHGKRTGLLFPIEDERWIVTLGGWAGDHPPADVAGFDEFARSLPASDIADVLPTLEPLSDVVVHKYPASLRRHYEKLEHFPSGYLVIGDAICSFNPVYGQGMTSAALQAEALDEVLQEDQGEDRLARSFFKRAARVVDIPWQLAVGEDFRFPETEGPKPPGTDLINRYVEWVHRATHVDEKIYGAFLQVMNLNQGPTSLFHPAIVWRVLRHRLRHSKRLVHESEAPRLPVQA